MDADKTGLLVVGGDACGEVLALAQGLSFWGGVDPASGRIIDAHHPQHGAQVSGKVLLMPTSRGSCSGSGVLLELALTGRAPAALVFCEDEEILTLGALVADRVFQRPVPTLRIPRGLYDRIADGGRVEVEGDTMRWVGGDATLRRADPTQLRLTEGDRALLDGKRGAAAAVAMDVLCRMAVAQGAGRLLDVTRGHIDGCILAHDANLIFAERMAELGAQVAIPTTVNAISVDRENWHRQGIGNDFGQRASRLADAYVRMGARPTFTCAPYLLEDVPRQGEPLGWSESNAVIFANSVLGARTAKHPDYLDLFIAMTGRAPATGLYTPQGRRPRRIVAVDLPQGAEGDGAVWPLIGWLAGRLSPDRIPLLTGLEAAQPSSDDLKALCAAFGTTSGVAMLHIAGHTPEADLPPAADADARSLTAADLAQAWRDFNRGPDRVDLVAIGSPHASAAELHRLADLLDGRRCGADSPMIVTLGRDTLRGLRGGGVLSRLQAAGVRLIPDLCWCSITEPLIPPSARVVMTSSGKYAHYAQGLHGRQVRFGSLADCVAAALTGRAPDPPGWVA